MKRWVQFLLCLVLSFSIWLIHNLSQTYADVVNVPVNATSNIEGRSAKASSTVTVVARCKTNGFRLQALSRRKKAAEVRFNAEDLFHKGGDIFGISPADLYKYAPDIFGDGVTLDAVIQNVEFRFPEENHRKVPVIPVKNITFKPQYTSIGDVKLTPDSVTVYGDPSRLQNIDAVVTETFYHKDLSHSVHGRVRIDAPYGIRISDTEASYFIDVARYVEIRSSVRLGTRNVPAGTTLSVYPSSAEVTFRCVFPTGGNPADNAEFYVDYEDFVGSLTGRCVIKGEGMAPGVIDYIVDPDVCDCVVHEQNDLR